MNQPSVQPARTKTSTPATGDYVLYRDIDRYLKGENDHTLICRVLGDWGLYAPGKLKLLVLASGAVIDKAPVLYTRPFDPAEFMHDIDTAPLTALDDGRIMTAAGAWIAAQRTTAVTGTDTPALPGGAQD
ncbi:hypothetical protein ACIG0C_30255 [Kitasatospora aureofaciens]|uniref:Uncharacterized protein n=1 Tax=Kitasatospora aureofaciens TaxID=1894 RepID=A0A1E7NEE1_KITAU|nr:hypothetical protein [Kitasatospora aureofaciens]ARF83238.1 hypothetical protein B6264_30325 [Kitasatospora aureofaciens]OEV39008.1 hypothetical protein HS99_0018055 [Kitasatospora aureofaciens]GGU99487.1 hypothetical protein GCM10010502_62450 [Kitasatospora aureofaciens]